MIRPHVVPQPLWMTARAVNPKAEDAEVAAPSAPAGPITVEGIKLEVQEEFRAEFGRYEEVARAAERAAERAEAARLFRNPLFSEDDQGSTVKAEVVEDDSGEEILLGGGIAREALVKGLLVCRAETPEQPAPASSSGSVWSIASPQVPEQPAEPHNRAWAPPTPESDSENRSPTPPLPIHNP